MSDSGKLTSCAISNLGLPIRFNPKDPKTGKIDNSLLVFQDSLSDTNLAVVLSEIFKQNEHTRKELKRILTGQFDELAAKKGRPWRHLFHLPKTQILDSHEEFNEFLNVKPELYRTMVSQNDATTVLRIKEDSYDALFDVTREKILRALDMLGINPEKSEIGYLH